MNAEPGRMVGLVRTADVVAASLAAQGVRHAFGMPGGEVVEILDALGRVGIVFTLARHETAAAAMAAGSWLATGRPPLLLTTIGPGLANAIDGIADASQERVPLIVLSGVVDRALRSRFTHQVVDHAAMLRPFVKASFEIDAAAPGATVARAIGLATAGLCGPVHLDLAPGVAAAAAGDTAVPGPVLVKRPVPSPRDPAIEALAARLANSRRPLILAGFTAARCPRSTGIVRLAERLGAPVVTTYKAKGVIREDHPLALGGAGLSPAADHILQGAVRQSDLVLTFGYDPIEMRAGWLDVPGLQDQVVDITPVPIDHGMYFPSLRIEAECGATAFALAEALDSHEGWPPSVVASIRTALAERFASPPGFGPHAIIDALQAHVGPEDLVTVDSGAHRILLSQKWVARRPLSLVQSAGFCTMATALPTAIGAKIAVPGRRVVAVLGDGGLEMGLGELATLRDSGLPVTVVVFQDQSLALIELKQAAARLPRAGVTLGETDFARIAEAFGGHGVNVETLPDLEREFVAAASRPVFSLIACRFSSHEYDGAF